MLDKRLQLPGPRSPVNYMNLKLNNSSLAFGSMPGRCRISVMVAGNLTPLPESASSVSFFFTGARSILVRETEFSDFYRSAGKPGFLRL